MSNLGSLDLNVDLGDLDTGQVNDFLKSGSRGIPEYAASCSGSSTIASGGDTTIINNNSCAQASPDEIIGEVEDL